MKKMLSLILAIVISSTIVVSAFATDQEAQGKSINIIEQISKDYNNLYKDAAVKGYKGQVAMLKSEINKSVTASSLQMIFGTLVLGGTIAAGVLVPEYDKSVIPNNGGNLEKFSQGVKRYFNGDQQVEKENIIKIAKQTGYIGGLCVGGIIAAALIGKGIANAVMASKKTDESRDIQRKIIELS